MQLSDNDKIINKDWLAARLC